MKILSIETSCDETAVAILDIAGKSSLPKIKILSHEVASQIKLHEQYGGVFPMMAKREHQKNILPLFVETLKAAKYFKLKIENYARPTKQSFGRELRIEEEKKIHKILDREPDLQKVFYNEISKIKKPKIDAIAVTTGPGLEPALWVGINFAKALATIWDLPLVPVNHMEGHILSVLVEEQIKYGSQKSKVKSQKVKFPAISLLVSGGHTELVLVKGWMKYKKIGQTRDDAAGEAFDKVARMLNLSYPGGPKISKLAETVRGKIEIPKEYTLPRPMINSKDFDFSFSGLKTAVLYMLKKIPNQTEEITKHIAHEFENAVVDVLVHKTLGAVKKYKIKTVIVGGGVAANSHLRKTLIDKVGELIPKTDIFFPTRELSTDNAVMIGIAGYFQFLSKKNKGSRLGTLRASGNLSL